MSNLFYPILAFEEHTPSPSLGYLFNRRWLDPYESVASPTIESGYPAPIAAGDVHRGHCHFAEV
jgi:hypothetical protein